MFYRHKKFSHTILQRNIDPDEVLLDASNLPHFDTNQFEGRVERSIKSKVPVIVGFVVFIVFVIFLVQTWNLQIRKGEALSLVSQSNRLDHDIIFSERGIIYDRFYRELAWNVPYDTSTNDNNVSSEYSLRKYNSGEGISVLLGFIGYPKLDKNGYLWRTDSIGKSGIEKSFNSVLSGVNGTRIIEVNALHKVQSANVIDKPKDGKNIILSIDLDIQEALFKAIKNGAERSHFNGASGVIMDVHTGEIIAITSYPEFSSQVLTDGVDVTKISSYAKDTSQPFLNRAVLGEYSPGSIVKPYVASAALQEAIIAPSKKILSTGEIRVPNPYDPQRDSIFKDWKAHGWVNMIDAIAVSSNVYFYSIGGGFGSQKGLGIERLAAYAVRFGLGTPTGINLGSEASGVVPTPSWKRITFGKDDPWRLGDTYNTAIGQFGFLVTPIQIVRYIASIANGGKLLSPHIIQGTTPKYRTIGIDSKNLAVVRNGMRQGAIRGTSIPINVNGIQISGKTGTAQVGVHNEYMNSWVIGFWPNDNPQFAFAVVFEKAPANTHYGAAPIMRHFFEWLVATYPDTYAKGIYPIHQKSI